MHFFCLGSHTRWTHTQHPARDFRTPRTTLAYHCVDNNTIMACSPIQTEPSSWIHKHRTQGNLHDHFTTERVVCTQNSHKTKRAHLLLTIFSRSDNGVFSNMFTVLLMATWILWLWQWWNNYFMHYKIIGSVYLARLPITYRAPLGVVSTLCSQRDRHGNQEVRNWHRVRWL